MMNIQRRFFPLMLSTFLLVSGISACSKSGDSDEPEYGAPDAPLGLSVVNQGSDSNPIVHISWNPVNCPPNYSVDYIVYKSSSIYGEYETLNSTQLTFFDDTAPINGDNFYKVKSSTVLGTSDFSSIVCFTYSGGGSSTQITAPTGLRASASGNDVSLSWNSVSGAYQYNVYYSQSSSGAWKELTATSNTSTTQTISETGTYYFAVTAVDRNWNESSYSSTASCSIQGGGTTPTKPSTPTGVKAVLNGEEIVVSWNASNGAEYYRVYYDRPYPYDGATFENCYKTSMKFYPKTMYGVWTFWIVAVGSDYQTSDASSKVTLNYTSGGGGQGGGGGSSQTKLDTPTNLSVDSRSSDAFVQISFDGVALTETYYLYRSTSPTSGYSKITASCGYLSSSKRYCFTDQSPKKGTTYYKIKAIASPTLISYYGIQDSDYSSYVKVTR